MNSPEWDDNLSKTFQSTNSTIYGSKVILQIVSAIVSNHGFIFLPQQRAWLWRLERYEEANYKCTKMKKYSGITAK